MTPIIAAMLACLSGTPAVHEARLEHLRFRLALVDSIIMDEAKVAKRTGNGTELHLYVHRRYELTKNYNKLVQSR